MFALVNELDPRWAHEHFNEMKLAAHSGSRAEESAFKTIDELLQHEHKMIVDKECLANSGTQKNKAWYTGKDVPKNSAHAHDSSKVIKTGLSELEKESGAKKTNKNHSRKDRQKSASKQAPSNRM